MKRRNPTTPSVPPREAFQPISVQPVGDHPLLFKLRCTVDLQLATIAKHLKPALAELEGSVLDVGAGQSPWCAWLPDTVVYQGIDVDHSDNFGMKKRRDVIYYDGKSIPMESGSYDAAMCIEVMEHAENPQFLLKEIARVLLPDGTLLLTVPWSARRHHLPHDYHRFTRERLHLLLSESGFHEIEIMERGSDIGAIANKLIILTIRLLRPRNVTDLVLTAIFALPCGVMAGGFAIAAHCADALGKGGREDPLGYFVRARRARQ